MGLNETGPSVPKIQIFHPTLEDMKDFASYIRKIEEMGAHKAGLAKIIPPNEWKPRQGPYDTDDVLNLVISAPISQLVHGRQGLYQQYNIQKRSLTVREFKKLAESPKYKTPDHFDFEELERKYWKNVSYNPPIYGADVPGSLYDDNVNEFNINRLNTILDLVGESYGIKIMGVNTAYLYFGMWKTTFAWHTEDMDLYSINYIHYGAPKSWYSIPPEHGRRLERLAAGFFPSSYKLCPAFLRHKMTLISPQVLKQYSIPFCKITQEAGEFMITFPYAYHAGYNHGYNCAESTNFATERWVEYGKRATKCLCRSDSVKISMEAFIKKFQPEKYDLWLQGKDIGPHPEDPTHISAAPAPSEYELAVLSKVSTSKSKRHPLFKPEYHTPDSESYNVSEALTHSPVLTKAAKKLFDYQPADDKNKTADAYLQTSPPSLKETVKKIRNRLNKKCKKKITSPNLKQTTKSRPNCTQPTPSIIPLTWTTTNLPSMNVSQLLEKFLNSGDSPNEMNKSPQTSSNSISESSQSVKNFSGDFGSPPPLLSSYKLNLEPKPSSSLSSLSPNSRSQHLFSPPPLQQQSSIVSTSANNYSDPSNFTETKVEFESHLNPESALVLDDHCLQQSIELPLSFGKVEAGTSTEDLLVNDIIINSKTVHSDDLVKLFSDGSSKAVNQILRCVPIPLYLYQYLPYNFFGEQLYNCAISTILPHCAVCILLNKFEINPNWIDAQSTIPKSSQISIPGAAFAFKVTDSSTTLDEVKFSPLLVCSDCKICVHTNCYGVVNVMPGEEKNWKCDRCSNKDYGIHCILCPLRGGALKQTQDENKWVHITCALMQPGVSFKSGIYKSPIDISQTKKARGHGTFKCVYCQKSNNRLSDYVSGNCIQCYKAPKCSSKFHVTCAHINGAVFEASDWPDPIRVYCNKCTKNVEATDSSMNSKQEKEIDIGTSVIGKFKNNRYYDAIIVDKQKVTLYHVHFDDNSFTKRLRVTDFISHDIEQNGCPEIGDTVVVLWNKETITGKYSGSHQSVIYTLQFEDESKIKSRRELFYLQGEKLPRKVQAKRSHATLVKNDALFWKQKFAQLRSPHN